MNSLFRTRVRYLLNSHPMEIGRMFQEDRTELFREIEQATQRAVRHWKDLEKQGRLGPDQIQEIVYQMIAPTDADPEDPLPLELENEILEWAENPPEATSPQKTETM